MAASMRRRLSEEVKALANTRERVAGALECGGKRKRDTAFATRVRGATPVRMSRQFQPKIPSEGGVALTLPAALQGALRALKGQRNFESWRGIFL